VTILPAILTNDHRSAKKIQYTLQVNVDYSTREAPRANVQK